MKNKIPGYQIKEELFRSKRTIIYRALRGKDKTSVIIKTLSIQSPSSNEISRLKHEAHVIQEIDGGGIIHAYEQIQYANNLALILEDIQGVSLHEYLGQTEQIGLEQFLRLAIDISQGLGHIHHQNVIHKDVNPSNIVFNRDTERIQIIDFGISTELSREKQDVNVTNKLEGSLPYISPEQTGRMNRELDYRTDYYSLGVTLYELFTGKRPFQADDPLELVYCHLAIIPPSPHGVNHDASRPISDIIMKLMAKNAEDRYQSIGALIRDLENCKRQWQEKGKIDPFPYGQNDISEKFQLPQRLYGRETEIETLLKVFENVTNGNAEFMLVAGYAGIGKSALVHEVHKPLAQQRGYFVMGKCDQQFRKNIPYDSLIQSFQELMRQILTQNEESIKSWKAKLLNVLGNNGQVIIDVIPALEILIGKQMKVPELDAVENQNRFNVIFQKFITVFEKPEHPLVIFLDDLQWADQATLDLIEVIMGNPDGRYLYLIGAYRDNEVSNSHPLMMMLEKVKKTKKVHSLFLSPLRDNHVSQLISDTLHTSLESISTLTDLVYNKTQGNPFFVNMFLQTLYLENLITFNLDQNVWEWNVEMIKEKEITNNVVELMIGRIQKLSREAQNVLSLAAAIGNHFDLYTLSLVHESSSKDLNQILWKSLQERLILPVDENYKYLDESSKSSHDVVFCFLHDRAQQAAYVLVPEEERAELHLKIGRLLLKSQNTDTLDENLFEIVDHLNEGRLLIDDKIEKQKLAKLNLRAAQKAKSSSAYDPALEYITIATHYLDQNIWESDYLFMFSFYLEKGEIEYLNAKWDQSIETFDYALKHTGCLLDRTRISEYKVTLYRMKNDLKQSLDIGIQALADLGIKIKAFPSAEDLNLEMQNLDKLLEGRDVDSLFDLPEMNDKEKLAAMVLLKECAPPAYFLGSTLVFIIGIKMTEITIRGGNNPHASVGYIYLSSLTLAVIATKFTMAYQFGRLALKLNNEKYQIKAYESLLLNMWGAFVLHYTESINTARDHLMRGYYSGVENGSYQWAGYCAMNCLFMDFWGPVNLPKVFEKTKKIIPILGKIDPNMVQYYFAIKATIFNLTHFSLDRCYLSNEVWPHVDEVIRDSTEKNDLLTLFVNAVCRLSLSTWFLDHQHALEYCEIAAKNHAGAAGIFINSAFCFHQCLALSASYESASEEEKVLYLKKIRGNEKKFEIWSEHSPSTYLHHLLLIRAELARITGEDMAAMDLYENAIESAHENHFLQNEAFASELYGRFWLSIGKHKTARLYLKNAYLAYEQWGATAKLKAMKQTYSLADSMLFDSRKQPWQSKPSTKTEYRVEGLDTMTIVKTSHAISEETQLDRLLVNLMLYTMQNAGADKLMLLLSEGKEKELLIQAKSFGNNKIEVLTSERPEDNSEISQGIVNYVARSLENVVLGEATREGNFTNDPYIQECRPKSVLCLPILNQAKLIGVLYLENNITSHAFTTDRLKVLEILASNAAISIDIARLYESLRESEAQKRNLINNTSSVIYIKDLDGRYLLINQMFEKLFHISNEEIKGKTAYDIFPLEIADTFHANDLKAVDSVLPLELEEIIPHDDREHTYISAKFPLKDISGKVYAVAGISTDITERKQTENAIKQLNEDLENRVHERTEALSIAKEQADRANEAKTVFLANMSHELRTPLNAIIGFSDILERNILNPKHKDYLHRISTSGGSLLTLINEILDLSKIESGKIELEYSVVSFANIINEIELLFEQDLHEKGVELLINISPTIPEALLLDDKKLRQILINLLGNAVKFTENGSITLTVDCEYLDDTTNSLINLNISVADTGVGIPKDQQTNIFDPFVQSKSQHTNIHGGTGLGLSITKLIVNAMGGRMSLESTVGRGSTFTVEIKEVEVSTVSELDTDTDEIFDFNAISFEPARVLIVDDIDYNRELFKTYLEEYKFELIEATNGSEAIESARKHRPNLILLDMKMPEMDGFEVSKVLNNDEHLKDIPIVVVTALALKHDKEQVCTICDGYLSKPVKREELIKKMMEFLSFTVKEVKNLRQPEKCNSYSNEDIEQKIVKLSKELLEKICYASKLGDVSAVTDLIAQVSQSDADFAEFLNGHATRYEYEEIQRILSRAI